MMFALKIAIIASLGIALLFLVRGLVRDFKDGAIYSHLGTFRRADQPIAFWVWTVGYFWGAVVVGVVVILAILGVVP
ncbi:MAG: hypothetical protein ABSD74_16770 [Rhizomicrobium sp.]|jgi:hypothetical protein